MKLVGKAVVVFIIFGAISIIFLTWHSLQHSKEEDLSHEKGVSHRILIATERDESKDSIVAHLKSQLTSAAVEINVIEIDQLSQVKERDWSAIVILSAPNNLSPHKEVLSFIENTDVKDKVLLLSGSGSKVTIVDIDKINTTYTNEKIAATPNEVVAHIKSILTK